MKTEDYEKLGAFYLGRPIDVRTGEDLPEPLLYDGKDLTTHAVILGMTGSGKTGLAISMIEEALIDGIPVIAIDPKGDLGNLMLTFPDLRAKDFRPWIDEGAAARAGETPDSYAAGQARLWKKGLASWGQGKERIARLESAAERVLYTPGSRAGTPLSILRSLDAPPRSFLDDDEAMRERIMSTVSSLLGLLGIEADPIQSREHILLSTLIDRAWREGRNVDMALLIHQIQKPPIDRIGILDLETVFPASERMGLAMRLNNLLASPGFSSWREGESLDIGRMLRTSDGRPRLSVLSIAHLSDSERMFVVTLVLTQLISWMRTQSGSQTLRAILYMDEIFGYFPPTANPPSKTPMLTLLKQARAYGVGCVLSTQNPVDLDYKGLSNCGTWLLGRLQTERDKARVLDGLESVSRTGSAALDRATLEKMLGGLESRVFLMNNVHEDEPVLFRSRWALSYLAGPLTRAQIKNLVSVKGDASESPSIAAAASFRRGKFGQTSRPQAVEKPVVADRPMLPAEANERFLPINTAVTSNDRPVYRPMLLAEATVHYKNSKANVDEWSTRILWAPLGDQVDGSPWANATRIDSLPELAREPDDSVIFEAPPAECLRKASYKKWAKQVKTTIYREHPLQLWKSKQPKLISMSSEEEGAFRGRISDCVRANRDLALEKLRQKFAPKLVRIQDRITRAEQRVEREEMQYTDRKTQTVVSLGATLVGALFGRKLTGVGNVGRAASTLRGASRAARERADIGRAEDLLKGYEQKLVDLEGEFRIALEETEDAAADFEAEIERLRVTARKSDIEINRFYLVWLPFLRHSDGSLEPAAAVE